MKQVVPTKGYECLIRDITTLYEQARRALVATYWEIGKRIVEEEQRAHGNEQTKRRFQQLLIDEDKLDFKLDMEPLKLLREIALDASIREVGGSLQIAKVYKSSRTEFFGVTWPSSDSPPYFQGRKYSQVTKPPVRYLDPETFEIMEMDLPDKILQEDDEVYGIHVDFVRDCYPEGRIKETICERDRHRLKSILKEVAYSEFMKQQREDVRKEELGS